MRARKKGGKLSKSREKRDEFLTTPCSCSSRGEPQAKLLGAFSLVRFFGASKEMNIKIIEPFFYRQFKNVQMQDVQSHEE